MIVNTLWYAQRDQYHSAEAALQHLARVILLSLLQIFSQINRILPLLGYTVSSTYCQGRELLTLVKIINNLEYDRWHFDGFWLDFSAWLYSWKTPQSLVRHMVRKFELAVKLDLIGFHSFACLPDLTINFS